MTGAVGDVPYVGIGKVFVRSKSSWENAVSCVNIKSVMVLNANAEPRLTVGCIIRLTIDVIVADLSSYAASDMSELNKKL
jgi:hypothetical protein